MNLSGILRQREKEIIMERLKQDGGRVARTAKWLGLHRCTLHRKIHEHGLYNFWMDCRKKAA